VPLVSCFYYKSTYKSNSILRKLLKGFPNILETCQQWIMEKVSLLKQMPCDGLPLQIDTSCPLEGFPYAGLISSLTTLENHIVICDIGICSLLDDYYLPFYVNISIDCVQFLFHFVCFSSWTEDSEN
jgi:hypothetical protein